MAADESGEQSVWGWLDRLAVLVGLVGASRAGRLWPVLLEQASEISHLLLQGGELGLQGASCSGSASSVGGQRWHLAGKQEQGLQERRARRR